MSAAGGTARLSKSCRRLRTMWAAGFMPPDNTTLTWKHAWTCMCVCLCMCVCQGCFTAACWNGWIGWGGVIKQSFHNGCNVSPSLCFQSWILNVVYSLFNISWIVCWWIHIVCACAYWCISVSLPLSLSHSPSLARSPSLSLSCSRAFPRSLAFSPCTHSLTLSRSCPRSLSHSLTLAPSLSHALSLCPSVYTYVCARE